MSTTVWGAWMAGPDKMYNAIPLGTKFQRQMKPSFLGSLLGWGWSINKDDLPEGSSWINKSQITSKVNAIRFPAKDPAYGLITKAMQSK